MLHNIPPLVQTRYLDAAIGSFESKDVFRVFMHDPMYPQTEKIAKSYIIAGLQTRKGLVVEFCETRNQKPGFDRNIVRCEEGDILLVHGIFLEIRVEQRFRRKKAYMHPTLHPEGATPETPTVPTPEEPFNPFW